MAPKATYNQVINPSFEAPATVGWTLYGGASIAATQSYRGSAALYLPAGQTPTSGVAATQTVAVVNSENAAYASAMIYLTANEGASMVGLKATTGGGTYYGYADPTKLNQWQRVSVALPSTGVTYTSVTLVAYCNHTAVGAIFWDAFQIEDANSLSTYFDGSTAGCVWLGRPHYSASYRPVECRTGGVVVPLTTYMALQSMQGWGRAAMTAVTLPFGLQGGSQFQRAIKQERQATIIGGIIAGAGGMDDLHNAQAALGRLLGADLTRPQALTRLIYDSGYANGVELNADVIYEGGLEFNSLSGLTLTSVPIRVLQPDPAMVENLERSAAVGGVTTQSTASVMYKPAGGRGGVPGQFEVVPGTLLNSAATQVTALGWVTATSGDQQLWCAAECSSASPTVGGNATGGVFVISTGATPPTVNVTKLGGPATNVPILAIQQTGAGADYVWMGGEFTSFTDYGGTNHSTFTYLVREQVSNSTLTWPITTITGGAVYAMAYCPQTYGQGVASFTDVLYVGGAFTAPRAAIFEIDNPNQASPTASVTPWGALPNSMTAIYGMTVAQNGTVYAIGSGGTNTYIVQGVPGASSWATIGTISGTYSPNSCSMCLGPDGCLYVAMTGASGHLLNPGGVITPCVAKWNGGGWTAIVGIANGSIGGPLAFDPAGRLHIAGQMTATTAIGQLVPGSITGGATGYVVWDGSSAHTELLSLSYAGMSNNFAINPSDGTVFATTNNTPANSSYVVPTTVSYQGTAPAPPKFIFKCSGTATWVGGVRNERTQQAIYFTGLLLAPGETLTIDTTPGASSVTTDWRGTMASYVAPMSNLADFVLLEGENYLSVLTSTALASANVTWYNRHYGIDGAGSNIPTASFEAN